MKNTLTLVLMVNKHIVKTIYNLYLILTFTLLSRNLRQNSMTISPTPVVYGDTNICHEPYIVSKSSLKLQTDSKVYQSGLTVCGDQSILFYTEVKKKRC